MGPGTVRLSEFDRYERGHWSGQAEAYQRTFGELVAGPVDALLAAARVGASTLLLDAGTGPGTVAARAIERGASVLAVDIEPSMLGLAGRAAPAAHLLRAAVQHLPLATGHVDAAVANFVIDHVGDPVAAATELGRVVRPGGAVAVTIWSRVRPANEVWAEILGAVQLPAPACALPVTPERTVERTPDGVTDLLHAAGLVDVRCDVVAWTYSVDPETWWHGITGGVGTTGSLIRAQTPETVQQIRSHYDRVTAAYRRDGGPITMPASALVGSGRVPEIR
jgi:SAM-dependent methyltransferase